MRNLIFIWAGAIISGLIVVLTIVTTLYWVGDRLL